MKKREGPEQADVAEGLVEPQGVNAGPPVDAEVPPSPDEQQDERPDGRQDERPGGRRDEEPDRAGGPPDPITAGGAGPDERVGLPEQRPGHPGQQGSMDTS